ncbi:MAG: 2-isopropylmalate synthase [Rhodothermales bacterium]|nr:2-isopropylmalate synthase [Rhodothermales bacterium]MBO6779367.1 2-isopropylmalate synthase [Rhodothermales bacterium]
MSDRVIIFDTTLRDGEQAPGASMTIPEKIQIAHQLARLGVDVIEAGFPISSPGQFEAVRRVASEVEGPVICGLARAKEADIEAAGKALESGTRTRIHTFIATSDIHLKSKFADPRYGTTLDQKRATILKMAAEAVSHARSFTDNVEFSAEDAGRTERAYLYEVIQAAIEAGATTINIPDTTGFCTPAEYASLFREVKEHCSLGDDVILSAHCHDDLGLAVANSLSAVLAGARQIECTINGIGERAGNAALEEVVMALQVRKDRFGIETGLNPRLLFETSRLVSTFSGFPVQPNKAIVGKNAFSHEAGIHQDGVLKARETYEIMRAEDVGQAVEAIRLGRHSGRHGLFSRLSKLGIQVADKDRDAIYEQFLKLADAKKEIGENDLYHLVHKDKPNANAPHYELEYAAASVATNAAPEAVVRIRHVRTGRVVERGATGDGPIDALYRAIDHAVDESHDLVNYSIRSITEGADALGEVSVLIGIGGPCFNGRASGTDVVLASAQAYINALNSLASFRSEEEAVRFVGDGIMRAFEGGVA